MSNAYGVEFVRKYHTNQPYRECRIYKFSDGTLVTVRMAGMDQTWDCQPFRDVSSIVKVDGPTQDRAWLASVLSAAYPKIGISVKA